MHNAELTQMPHWLEMVNNYLKIQSPVKAKFEICYFHPLGLLL